MIKLTREYYFKSRKCTLWPFRYYIQHKLKESYQSKAKQRMIKLFYLLRPLPDKQIWNVVIKDFILIYNMYIFQMSSTTATLIMIAVLACTIRGDHNDIDINNVYSYVQSNKHDPNYVLTRLCGSNQTCTDPVEQPTDWCCYCECSKDCVAKGMDIQILLFHGNSCIDC